jgi:glycosyltransferase involved in cell wall biosynthesis
MSLIIILIGANKIIFTSKYEQSYARKRIPFIKRRSSVIKIRPNITGVLHSKSINERNIDIVYFGHIRPNKGIEKYIQSVKDISFPVKAIIVGQVFTGYELYSQNIFAQCKQHHIEIILNLPNNDVSEILNNTKIAYLPFPDGASERRGSLLAVFANGTAVLTTCGKYTTKELAEVILDDNNYSIEEVLNNNSLLEQKQQAIINYMNTQIPHSWDDVAIKYELFL